MSMKALDEFFAELPYALREQVRDYAQSVRDAAHDICSDAGVDSSAEMTEQLMWLAALRRIHAIVNSAFWTVESANRLLQQQGAGAASVGSTDYSEGSEMYSDLATLQRDLESLAQQLGVADLVGFSWSEVAQALADGHRRS